MNERFVEQSEALTALLIEAAIKKAQQKNPVPPGFDGTCPECEEVIPIKRIEMGFYNCVDCQKRKEHPNANIPSEPL